ncbi:ras-related protein Rap-1b-like [Stegodyphus dumicola]|uniref:ras-related protein Rap-1b-like n=1 Tax=Stegodyphus dumicola TaxID=202533 RepID=UPI0015AFFD29|nr:ras-related protein Rap-1b-like [Stegodyphus dumicola]XP_035219115.1 ras-related protein Rap-1b-like [Stegodyphus dumicola]
MPSSHTPSLNSINENSCYDIKGHYRLVLMGAACVGKTAIVHQFLYEHFPSEYLPTVEELYRGEYDVGNTGLILDILDTSGTYEFPAMRKLAVDTGDAFILVYAINDDESFEEVRRLRQLLMDSKQSNVPIVVVGNKCDLEKQRVIQKEVADTIVAIDWENRFVEASAKENINIVRIFKELLVQANFPYDLNPAVQKRRTSLPLYALPKTNNNVTKNKKIKRNSCAVS